MIQVQQYYKSTDQRVRINKLTSLNDQKVELVVSDFRLDNPHWIELTLDQWNELLEFVHDQEWTNVNSNPKDEEGG